MQSDNHHDSLSKEQKTGFVLLLVFGVLAVGMGFLQMRNTIYHPFAIERTVAENDAPVVVDENAQLQAIDTDQDGLSNYEELFFYETSPYLPDTDSDGLSDAEEINNGTDPNCAEGKSCLTEVLEETEEVTDDALQLPSSESTLDVLGGSGVVEPEADSITEITELFQDPVQLRAILAQSGELSPEQLEQIDDETLLELVDELLGEQQFSLPAPEASTTTAQ